MPDNKTIENIKAQIFRIQSIIEEVNPDYLIRPFGSITNGFLLKDCSDIDLTILIPEKYDTHPYFYYHKILRKLKDHDGLTVWNYILTKRLFIITSEPEDGPEIEILFNNVNGLLNSEYIRTMAGIDCRFHKLGYYIKHYVKKHGIFTKQNKLNSFSLMCMLIVFLQDKCDPPVLPRIIGVREN